MAILGSLSMAEDSSLTARGIFDDLPKEVARAIVSDTSSWYMADFDRKHWRSLYLELFVDSGYIQSDPEDTRRYQITERGQAAYQDWLTS
jgi:hypothetical protein